MKPQANLKEIYATVRRHLLAQGRRSEKANMDGRMVCRYDIIA